MFCHYGTSRSTLLLRKVGESETTGVYISKIFPMYVKAVLCYYNMMIMIWCFTSLSTLFKSYRDAGRMIMKSSVQLNAFSGI